MEQRLGAMGILYVDAPISGGAAKAASGQMTVMSAARPEAYAAAGADLISTSVITQSDSAAASKVVIHYDG